MTERLRTIGQFHHWLLRLEQAGIPIRFSHSWRSLSDELATAKNAIGRLDHFEKLGWDELRTARLSPAYIGCLLAWLDNPDPAVLETIIEAEAARYEHRRNSWVAWAGAAVLILVGMAAFWSSVVLLLPQYQELGRFLEFDEFPILATFSGQSVWGVVMLGSLVVGGLIIVATVAIYRSFRSPKLETAINNLHISQAAMVDEQLDVAAARSQLSTNITPLQQWALGEAEDAPHGKDPHSPRPASTSRKRFSFVGHTWILREIISQAFQRKPVAVGVVVGGLFALALGALTFGAVSDLIVVVSRP